MAAILEVQEKVLDSATERQGATEVPRKFQIRVDQDSARAYEIRRATHPDLPMSGDSLDGDDELVVVSRAFNRAVGSDGKPAKYWWIADVTYGLPNDASSASGPTGDTNNAKLIRVRVSGSEQATYTLASRGHNGAMGNVLVNSAADTYPDAQEVVDCDMAITIDYESDTFNPDVAEAARNLINDAQIVMSVPQGRVTWQKTFAAKTLLVKTIDYDVGISRKDSGTHTWRVSVGLIYRRDTWVKALPDCGYREAGAPTWDDTKMYLNGSGSKLTPGSQIVSASSLQFQPYFDSGAVMTFLQTIM